MKLLEEDVELISSKRSIDTAMPPPITITIPITTTITSTNSIRALRGKTTSNANIFPVKHTTSTNTNRSKRLWLKLKLNDKDDLNVFINHSVNVSRLENELANDFVNDIANDFVNDIANDFVKTSFDKPGGGGAP